MSSNQEQDRMVEERLKAIEVLLSSEDEQRQQGSGIRTFAGATSLLKRER